jgi:hypothetical protein
MDPGIFKPSLELVFNRAAAAPRILGHRIEADDEVANASKIPLQAEKSGSRV